MIFELVVCGAAVFLLGRGIYHSGVLTGWIAEGLMSTRPKAPPARRIAVAGPTLDELHAAEMALIDKHNKRMFLDNPLAFWLDPNMWGDNPGWNRDEYGDDPVIETQTHAVGSTMDYMLTDEEWDRKYRLSSPKHAYRIVIDPPPPCPNCKTGRREVMNVHGGEATMWACTDCGAEFTRAGETRRSKRQRKLRESSDIADRHIAEPTHAERKERAWVVCRERHHGACPSIECGFPVAKRDGYYYCTNNGCRHSKKGWR